MDRALGQRMVNIISSDAPLGGLETWIEAACRGDREALGRALLSFRDYLLLVANEAIHPALGAKVGASDIVQDTFFRAHRGFAEFRGRSEAEWRNWLRTILVRSLAHQHRRYEMTAKRRQGCEIPMQSGVVHGPKSGDPTPSRELARRERELALMAALDRLPDHYRDVVIWHHRERLPFDEIGRRRGISAEAARKLWTRALGRLRQELGPEHGSP
jgi:RNA polymerase sigma-70 factor (ECF subfamily)